VFIISDRDFVYMEARTDNFPEEGDILISGYSVEREDVPPKAGIVRGHVYHTGTQKITFAVVLNASACVRAWWCG